MAACTSKLAPPVAMEPCPVCWGKGEWPAISDREWHAHAGRRGCDYIRRCGFCRAAGEVKASRIAVAPAEASPRLVEPPIREDA